jgi:hypothetical protein
MSPLNELLEKLENSKKFNANLMQNAAIMLRSLSSEIEVLKRILSKKDKLETENERLKKVIYEMNSRLDKKNFKKINVPQ